LSFVVDSAGQTNDGSLLPERPDVTMRHKTEKRKEVMVGSIPIYRCGVPCVIVGESWPAWLPVVPALGGRVSVIVCGATAAWDEEIIQDAARLEVNSKTAEVFVRESAEDTLMFVSGSAKFLLKWKSVLEGKKSLVLALDNGSRVSGALSNAYPDVCWRRVRHADVGGVTTCNNWMGSSTAIKLGAVEGVSYHRTIGEVLKPTLRGRFGKDRSAPASEVGTDEGTAKVVMEGQGLVSPNGLWPTSYQSLKIVAPSVFSSTGWVHRTLDPVELGAAWDLPVNTLKALERLEKGEFGSHEATQMICRAAPCKSLWAFGQAMCLFGLQANAFGGRQGDFDQGNRADDEAHRGFGFYVDDLAKEQDSARHGSETAAERRLREAKAVKEDDAAVPVHLWNERVLQDWNARSDQDETSRKLDTIRSKFLLRRWKQNLRKSFVAYLSEEHGYNWQSQETRSTELELDLEAGMDALRRAMDATWWNWDSGSALFFWRWPKEFRREARDGTPIRVSGTLPKYRRPQDAERDVARRVKVGAKLENVRSKGYIAPGKVESLTGFFAVDKGDADIRMVYDASKSGLNEKLWAPSFCLSTVDSTFRAIESTTRLGDLDLGEMFLNFKLHKFIRPYAGVDLTAYVSTDLSGASTGTPCWERWERCLMGLKPSPYNATRAFAWCEEVIRGDPSDDRNALRWDRVRLNLPGEAAYDPTLPWLSKVVEDLPCERIAGDFFSYIDDIRSSGCSVDECWNVSRRVASYCGYLGIQDAPRKRRAPSQTPGAWAGSNVVITPDGLAVTVSTEKWERTQELVTKWARRVEDKSDVGVKEFESDLGFLIYVSRTFPSMKPYLKGFHLTLHGWRPDRDEEGWKVVELEVGLARDEWASDCGGKEGDKTSAGVPSRVKAVPRLKDDLRALSELTASVTPPLRLVRPRKVCSVRYGFGDASGSGFGSTFSSPGAVLYRHGVWGSDGDGRSSNWRELTNLVETLEGEAKEGRLQGCEVFVFTDNSTAEAAFFKGTSSSILLFDLVLRLRRLEVDQRCMLHVIHVAGTRMIGQGSDGLSRGNFTEGVMMGRSMVSYVPLSKSALDRSEGLEDWIRSWAGAAMETLAPSDWFLRGQGILGFDLDERGYTMPSYRAGTFLWVPPPAVALTAIEELRRSRHKRLSNLHIFVCPRLMTYRWRKLVLKEADFVFEVPVGTPGVWEKEMHEPLLIAICLPFISHSPWKLGGTPRLLALERRLRRVWKDATGDPRLVLRELLKLPRRLSGVSAELVRRVLYSAGGGQVPCGRTQG
jgi:hypothetical protein